MLDEQPAGGPPLLLAVDDVGEDRHGAVGGGEMRTADSSALLQAQFEVIVAGA